MRVLFVMKWSVQVHLITLSLKYILYQNSKLNKDFEMFFDLPYVMPKEGVNFPKSS